MKILLVGDSTETNIISFHEGFRRGMSRMLNIRFYGNGYPHFNPDLRVPDIIELMYPDGLPDLLIADDFGLTPNIEDLKFNRQGFEEVNIPKAITFSDFWNITEHGHHEAFMDWLEYYGITYVLSSYLPPLDIFAGTRAAHRFVWLPICIDPGMMNDWQQPKQYDVGFLGAGIVDYVDFYPERHAIHRKLAQRSDLKYLAARHPGYAPMNDAHPMFGKNFSKLLNSCRIHIVTGSRYNNPFGKYFETMASRSLLLGIEPRGAEALGLIDGVNYVAITPENVLEKVDYYLAHPGLSEQIAEEGYRLTMRRHTCYARAMDLYELVQNDKKGLPDSQRTGQQPIHISSKPSVKRPRVLLVADVPNWIFERHCRTLKELLSDEFEFSIAYKDQFYSEQDYDLIYPLEWHVLYTQQILTPHKYVTGIRSHISWDGYSPEQLAHYLSAKYGKVHVVSRRLYNIFRPVLPGVEYITHGVDTAFFTPQTSAAQSGTSLRLGWAGNRASIAKGFEEFIEPLGKIPGVEVVFCGYSDRNLTMEDMRGFYDSIDAYICTSSSEGNNNSLMEAASMKRAIITTNVGTANEYLLHGKSALFVERDPEEFRHAVIQLRDDPALRAAMGEEAGFAIRNGWDWRQKAEDYRRFLRHALEASHSHQEHIKEQDSIDLKSLLRQAQDALISTDFLRAEHLLRMAVDHFPDMVDLYTVLCDVLIEQGRTAEAISVLQSARRLHVDAPVLIKKARELGVME